VLVAVCDVKEKLPVDKSNAAGLVCPQPFTIKLINADKIVK
jgi:hypothetical protein